MDNLLGHKEVPIGFGMELAKNMEAMNHFSNLKESDRVKVVERARQIKSKHEMEHYVSSLKDQSFT